MKLTRDPVTGAPAAQIGEMLVILKEDIDPEQLETAPMQDVVQCALGPEEMRA